MKHFNEEAFVADVACICWEQMLLETDDINVLVNDWSNFFSIIIDKHAPLIEMRVSETYCPSIDKDLKNLMKTRDKLKKCAVKTKSIILMDSYRHMRNKVNAVNIKLKKQFCTSKTSACKGYMKETWKTVHELLNKRSKSSNVDCLKELDLEIVNKKDISNAMNNYFCSIGNDLANDIDPVPNPLLYGNYEVNYKKARFYSKAITIQDIRNAFAKIKTAKSFGTDCISSYFSKLALPFIENSLTLLFNSSMETSQFPDAWKIARIVSVFKDEDKEIKSNYRPISILPVTSRLCEKLIADQLYQYMNENSLISPDQVGFLQHDSTATCLLTNTDEWYKGFDLGKLVGLVFIDLKKAFDTVDNQIFLEKFMLYCIQQCELSWFTSYLTKRKQFCMLNGTEPDLGT